MKFKIKSRFSGTVLFSLETESLKLCVEAAVKSGANLSGADLYGANLSRADLSRADLSCADLSGAYLSRANLYGANLSRADLSCADLSGADLYGANLSCADLSGAYLSRANDEKLILAGERPVIQIGPLGSRCAYLLAFLTDAGIYVRAGCFWDTLEKFSAAVEKEHGNNIYGEEYAAAITMIKAHAKLWTPEEPSNG